MNGIIHGCTHPNHLDVSDVLTERDMVLGIMHCECIVYDVYMFWTFLKLMSDIYLSIFPC